MSGLKDNMPLLAWTLKSPPVSVRLFALLGVKNAHIRKSWRKIAFGSAQNATFWSKLRFGLRQKSHPKRTKFMDLLRSINQNAHTVTVGLMMNYENTHNNSSLTPEASRPSSDLSALPLHEAPLTPPISSIIKIQTQKHNLKINQTTTIKVKKFLLS